MTRLIVIIFLLLNVFEGRSQHHFIVLKKKSRTLRYFAVDDRFTFRLKDGRWFNGIINRITADSFYMTQEIIHFNLMFIDTLHFGGFQFTLDDIADLPSAKEEVVFRGNETDIILGHEKFAWVRNGFIFQVLGAGYAGLSITNDLIRGDPPFAKNNLPALGISAGLFLLGTLLHQHFNPHWHIGKKYHLEIILADPSSNKNPSG